MSRSKELPTLERMKKYSQEASFLVLSKPNQQITRCLSIVSGIAATTRKFINNIRVQKGWKALLGNK